MKLILALGLGLMSAFFLITLFALALISIYALGYVLCSEYYTWSARAFMIFLCLFTIFNSIYWGYAFLNFIF